MPSTLPSYLDSRSRSQVKAKGFTVEFRVHSISPEPFRRFSLKFTQMFLSVKQCEKSLTRLHRLKVKATLEFQICSIPPEPFARFSLNFTQKFLSVRQRVEHMTLLRRIKVKVTLQGHVIYPPVCVHSISPDPFERFSFHFTQKFLSVRQNAEPVTLLRRLKVKVKLQGRGIYP